MGVEKGLFRLISAPVDGFISAAAFLYRNVPEVFLTHFVFSPQYKDGLNYDSKSHLFECDNVLNSCLSLPQCSWQRCERGQQNQIHSSSPSLLPAVSAPDLSPLSGHPETGLLLVIHLLHLLHTAATLSARWLPTPLPAFPLPVPATSASWVPGSGACGEHVSGLPSEPQDGFANRGSLHDSSEWVPLLPEPGLYSSAGYSCTAAPGPYLCTDGPGRRAATLSEYGLQRGLPGGSSHLHSRLLWQVTPGDGEGSQTPAGLHYHACVAVPYPELSICRPPLSLRRHRYTSSMSSSPVPLKDTPKTQAEVQRQDRPGGSHHTDVTNAPPTHEILRHCKNFTAIFWTVIFFINLCYCRLSSLWMRWKQQCDRTPTSFSASSQLCDSWANLRRAQNTKYLWQGCLAAWHVFF